MIEVWYLRAKRWEHAEWVAVDPHNVKDARHQFRSFVRSQTDPERYRLVLREVLLTGRDVTRKAGAR
jgi:hypothetical protein